MTSSLYWHLIAAWIYLYYAFIDIQTPLINDKCALITQSQRVKVLNLREECPPDPMFCMQTTVYQISYSPWPP